MERVLARPLLESRPALARSISHRARHVALRRSAAALVLRDALLHERWPLTEPLLALCADGPQRFFHLPRLFELRRGQRRVRAHATRVLDVHARLPHATLSCAVGALHHEPERA